MFSKHAHRLKKQARKEDAEERLERYIDWSERTALTVVDTGALLDFQSGNGLFLRGRVSRIDLLTDGYRAVLLAPVRPDWDAAIRMPLLQMAIADLYSVPASDTYVGVQELDGSGLKAKRFSQAERETALHRFRGLAVSSGKSAPRHSGNSAPGGHPC